MTVSLEFIRDGEKKEKIIPEDQVPLKITPVEDEKCRRMDVSNKLIENDV